MATRLGLHSHFQRNNEAQHYPPVTWPLRTARAGYRFFFDRGFVFSGWNSAATAPAGSRTTAILAPPID